MKDFQKEIRYEENGDILFATPPTKRILAVDALHPGSDKPEITTAAQVAIDEFLKGVRAYWGIGMANELTTDAALRGFACAEQNAHDEAHLFEATLAAMRQDALAPIQGPLTLEETLEQMYGVREDEVGE